MQPFTLLVKPASADCNLRCSYCFYLEKLNLYQQQRPRMSEEVLEKMISSYLATPQPSYSIGWQGGEPTLMGLDFFRKVTEFQQKYGQAGMPVANGLQTNAVPIDDAMAEHFARYNFLAGCSLDGPPEVHDIYRRTVGGGPTHEQVVKGIETLQRHGVECNILVLVSQANVHKARDVYQYLCDKGFYYHQYIPCVEFDSRNGEPMPYAITGEEWGRFKSEIFDQWYPQDIYRVSIRHFDSILTKLVDNQVNMCNMGTNCCQYFVVEYNGDLYPCDFFVEPNLKLGNIMNMTWGQAQTSPIYKEFGARKAQWPAECDRCPHLELCGGDCIKHRMHQGNSYRNLSWLCSGMKAFYDYARPRFEELGAQIQRERQQQQTPAHPEAAGATGSTNRKVGRNEPCPCGSGRKYKKCCGAG